MNISLPSFVVRGTNGSVDVAATTAKFGDELTKFIAANETEVAVIASAVNAVFDDYRGATLTTPTLVTYALGKLNATPANMATLSDRIRAYVHDNSDRPAIRSKEGKKEILVPAEAPRTRAFRISKGVGGGVSRWSDVPEKSDASETVETPAS